MQRCDCQKGNIRKENSNTREAGTGTETIKGKNQETSSTKFIKDLSFFSLITVDQNTNFPPLNQKVSR